MIPCPSCGRSNEHHYRFCLGCGTPLSGAPAPRDDATGGGAAPPPGATGGTLDRTAAAPRPDAGLAAEAYSPTVAVPVQPTARTLPRTTPVIDGTRDAARRCHACGVTLPDGFLFCGQCGARWREPVAAHAVTRPAGTGDDDARTLGRLVTLRPDGTEGEVIALRAGEQTLGRSAAIAFPADRLLSPRHATFLTRGGRLYVRDEQSLNGVFLRLTAEHPLASGSVLRVGQQLLRYDDARDFERLAPALPGDDAHVLGSPDGGAWGRLVQLLAPTRMGNVYLLWGPEVTLGRERAQLVFPHDGFVSGTHAALVRDAGGVRLVDRGSSNGTFVRLRGEVPLSHGALLLVGQRVLRVELA